MQALQHRQWCCLLKVVNGSLQSSQFSASSIKLKKKKKGGEYEWMLFNFLIRFFFFLSGNRLPSGIHAGGSDSESLSESLLELEICDKKWIGIAKFVLIMTESPKSTPGTPKSGLKSSLPRLEEKTR